MESKTVLVTIGKLFAHGILFSVLMTVFEILLSLAMVGFLVAGIVFGGIAGFLLVLLVVFLLFAAAEGYANSVVTRFLWFKVEAGFKVYLGQGLILVFTFLVIQSIPLLALAAFLQPVVSATDWLVLRVVLTIGYAFVAGFVGRAVADRWRIGGLRKGIRDHVATTRADVWVPTVENPDGLECPRCSGKRLIIAPDRSALCLDCRKGIHSTMWIRQPQ